MRARTRPGSAVDLPSWLAYAYAPILPYLKRLITIRRAGPREHNPRDILLPRGYVAEVVATGLNTPVHCCFDDEGACWHRGSLYLANTDTLLRIGPDGGLDEILTDLPGRGDHQTNYPVLGPDGRLYFGVGS